MAKREVNVGNLFRDNPPEDRSVLKNKIEGEKISFKGHQKPYKSDFKNIKNRSVDKESLFKNPPEYKPVFKSVPWLTTMRLTWMVALVVFGIAGLKIAGLIALPHIGGDLAFNIPDATIGKPYSVDFSNDLIYSLDPKKENGPYTFYLGSGKGFPPMGLTLGIDGVLKGAPTGRGDESFQVCVKDVSGKSICQNYHISVNSEQTQISSQTSQSKCPVTISDTACGSRPYGSNGPVVDTVPVPVNCNCPSGTNPVASITTWTDGSQWRNCACF